MAWKRVLPVLSCALLSFVVLAEESRPSWQAKLTGTYEYLSIYEDPYSSENGPQCPQTLNFGDLMVENGVYKLDIMKDLQFGNVSCQFNDGMSVDMSLHNLTSKKPPKAGSDGTQSFKYWRGSLHPPSETNVMTCEKLGPVPGLNVEVVRNRDVFVQLFHMLGEDATLEKESETIMQAFGDKPSISVEVGNNLCVFMTEQLVKFFVWIADGKDAELFPFSNEVGEPSRHPDEHEEFEPKLETWLPRKYWNINVGKVFGVSLPHSDSRCPKFLHLRHVSLDEHGHAQVDLGKDVQFGEDKCKVNPNTKHGVLKFNLTSDYENLQPSPEQHLHAPNEEIDYSAEVHTNSSFIYLAGYLPTVPVKNFMNCTGLGAFPNITVSMTDANPYMTIAKRQESKNESLEVSEMNFLISIGFGHRFCSYLKHEDIKLLKERGEEYAEADPYPDYGYEHPPDEKVENLAFSQICPCHSSFPIDYETRGKTEFLIGIFMNASMEMHNAPQGDHDEKRADINFNESDICSKNVSYGVFPFVDALFRILEDSQSPAAIMFVGAVTQIYEDMFGHTASLTIMLQRVWTEIQYSRPHQLVVLQKKDADCEASPLTKNSLLLLDFEHTFVRMWNRAIMKDINKTEIDEFYSTEGLSQKFTLHMFQAAEDGSLLKCIYTSSKWAKTLLTPQCKTKGSFDLLEHIGTPEPNSYIGTPEPASYPGTPEPASYPGTPEPTHDIRNETTGINPSATSSTTPSPIPSKSPVASNGTNASPSVSPASPSPPPSPSVSPDTSSGPACFPGAAKVELEDGSLLPIAALKVGQKIRDASGSFSRVLLFAHSNSEVEAEFVHIESSMGDIVLSPSHYIYANNEMLVAEKVNVGDRVWVLELNNTKLVSSAPVWNITRVVRKGLFNPQTASGSIAVYWKGNAVIASTYTAALEPKLAHKLLSPLRWLESKLGKTIPILSSFLIDGSVMWSQVLPSGSQSYSDELSLGRN